MDRADSREAALLRLVFGGQQANEEVWSEQDVLEALCALCATPHGRGVLTKRAQAVGARACVWPSRVAGTRILRRRSYTRSRSVRPACPCLCLDHSILKACTGKAGALRPA